MDILHFIISSVDRHSGCFHFGAVMNNAAMNIHVQFFVLKCVLTSLGSLPRSGIAGSKDYCMFNVLSNYFLNCFLKWLHHFTFLPTVYDEATVSKVGWFWVEACRL